MIPRFACLLLFTFGSLCAAQEPEKPDPGRFGSPLMRVWLPSTLAIDHHEFRSQLQKQMSAEEAESQPADITAAEAISDAEPPEREGILVYHDPEPLKADSPQDRRIEASILSFPGYFPGQPWLKPVRFVKVGSREEFVKEVRRRTYVDHDPSWGILQEQENGYFFIPTLQWIDVKGNSTVLDRYLRHVSRYWTYRDGYMFFGDFEEILTMEFPDPRTLEPKGTDAGRDVFVQVDLNSVLPRQKRILWDVIRKHAERSLQQYDDEGDAEYAFRKSVGDLQLNLIQAVTQDLESIKLGIDFASEEKPAEAKLELVARPRVNLERYFGTSGIGTPALAAFIEEPAAMTLATSWGLPDRMVTTFERLQQVVDAKLDQQTGWTVGAILASEELTYDLLETIRGNNQIAVKLKQTEHGFTLFGGMRIQNAERVSKNLAIVLNGFTSVDGWGVQQSRDASGRTYFSFRPADLSETVAKHRREHFPAELHFIVVDEILWFSAGRQDSLDILAQSLDRIEEKTDQPMRTSIPLALIDVSLDELFPKDEWMKPAGFGRAPPTGFDGVPLAMMEKLDSLIPRRGANRGYVRWSAAAASYSLQLNDEGAVKTVVLDGDSEQKSRFVTLHKSKSSQESNADSVKLKPTTIAAGESDELMTFSLAIATPDPATEMKKFLQPDQSRIRIQFDAGEKRVTAKATVGLGVIKHVYSRMLESQNQWLRPFVIETGDGTLGQFGEDIDLRVYSPSK